MHLDDAEDMALALMEDHGIGNTWRFQFDNAKRRCGACFHKRKVITLSRHFVQYNAEAEVRDTVLHEIAHAFAGHEVGHGVRWQSWAIRVGARPERCSANAVMPQGNVEGLCGGECTTRHVRHRMPPARLRDAYACNTCRMPITWVRLRLPAAQK